MAKENIEKEVENAVENAKEEKVEKTSDKVEKPVEYEDDLDLFEWERARDEDGNGSVENDSLVYDVPYRMGRYPGEKYDSYKMGYILQIGGKKIARKFYCVPPQATTEMYELAKEIFGDNEKMPVQIVRNTRTRTLRNKTKTTVTYQIRVTTKDDFGSDISLNFSPSSAGDRANFENMLSYLRNTGKIQ